MPRKPTIHSINALLDRANAQALRLVEERARQIMREHPECTEFVMAMGSATFLTIYQFAYDDDPTDFIERREHWSVNDMWTDGCVKRPDWLDPLTEIFDEFDNALHISGTPMRFTATSPVTTDW